MDLKDVSLDAPLEDLRGKLLVETEAGRTLLQWKSDSDTTVKLSAHLPDGRRKKLERVPLSRTLRQVAASLSASRPLRAFEVSEAEIDFQVRPFLAGLAYLPIIIGTVLALVGAVWVSLGFLRLAIMFAGLTIAGIALDGLKKSMRFRQWTLSHGREQTKAIDVALPPLREEIEVDDIKAEYGRLLSDIAYRIENPALFDPHEPTSKEFTLALLQWDNNDGVVGDDELRELALRVRSTFAAARANAERIGMNHLPEEARDRAGTALKAARLATDDGASEAERENALRRAVEILDELALYFLPSGAEARKAITGSAPLQLPGRRSS